MNQIQDIIICLKLTIVNFAIIVGVSLGILIVRFKWLATPVLGIATIALFGLMITLFSMIGQGIGALPAICAVFLYSLLPIVRNTHTALENLSPGLREAGRGIGMTFWQRLRWVEVANHSSGSAAVWRNYNSVQRES